MSHLLFEPDRVDNPVDHWYLNRLHVCSCQLKVAFSCIVCLATQATKAVKGTLNKLTPEKFERLLQQLVDVVTSAEVLHTTISLVFESAVAQPTFVAMYADLCDRLSKVGQHYMLLRRLQHNGIARLLGAGLHACKLSSLWCCQSFGQVSLKDVLSRRKYAHHCVFQCSSSLMQ